MYAQSTYYVQPQAYQPQQQTSQQYYAREGEMAYGLGTGGWMALGQPTGNYQWYKYARTGDNGYYLWNRDIECVGVWWVPEKLYIPYRNTYLVRGLAGNVPPIPLP